jgi:hypothetical protein
MNRGTLEWYEQLARSLIWIAGIVLLLSMIGAVTIAGSGNAAPLLEDIAQQGRGFAALASLGGGLTAAGLLAGTGAILRVLVLEQLEKLGPEPNSGDGDSDPEQEQLPLSESRRRERTETRRRERQ